MTPREVHISIDLGLQKLGSFAYNNIKPEYIDYVFNRMGYQYIIEKTTRRDDPRQAGLEDNITRLSTIQELIDEVSLIVFNNVINKKQFSVLPQDHFSFVEAQGDVVFSCTDDALTFTTSPVSEYLTTLSFKISDFGSPDSTPFSDTKIYKVINTTPVEIFDFSDFSTGLSDVEEIFTVKNKILTEINRTQSNLKVYWELYKGNYYPDQLIFVSNDNAFVGQGMKIEYTSILNSSSSFTNTVYAKVVDGSGENFDSKDSYCRLLSNEEVYHVLNHPFGTTSPESPIITINKDQITIYINERFILKGLTLKYIRNPREMNLSLNQSYGIQDPRALGKIIDMAIQYLHATIESQGYQAMALENQQRD